MEKDKSNIQKVFSQNVMNVYQLMDFDHIVLEYAIRSVGNLNATLKKKFGIESRHYIAQQCEDQLRQIRENDSLREKYQDIFNQCIVLLVSYFASSLSDVFMVVAPKSIGKIGNPKLLSEEVRFNLSELIEANFNLSNSIGELLINKKSISFQDMQSIQRAFNEYCGFAPLKNSDVDNIIFGQACRHVIVHAGAIADSKLIKQISTATSRRIKIEIVQDRRIQFNPDQIKLLGSSMESYMKNLCGGI